MTKFERFAVAMSVLLLDMRSEDMSNEKTTLYFEDQHGDSKEIPQTYIDDVLASDIHQEQIRLLLKVSVLAAVTQYPNDFMQKHSGHGPTQKSEFVYSSIVYNHAYLVDEYIHDQYILDHPEFHTLHLCPECNSDNVQLKAWVRPNQNNKLVDYLTDQVTDGFCDDCHQHVITDTVEMNVRHKVIGFTVCNDNPAQVHPRIIDNKMVYNLLDADEMLRDLTTDGDWKLKTLWTDDISDPVKMFSGDPRNPKP